MASLFVDALSVIDFSYLDPHRGVIGESWIVDIELEGELNEEGMVFDFSHVKKAIKAAIDGGMDHRFVVPRHLADLTVEHGETRATVRYIQPDRGVIIEYTAPHEAFYWLDSELVTMESALNDIQSLVRGVVPDNVTNVNVTLRAEDHADAYYHYSHGLKKHQGDCQRMIHGHRSRIQVFRNGQRQPETEAEIANAWRDIYLITDEDVTGECTVSGVACYSMAYEAKQGYFTLTLPKTRCDILPTDTTVELIAEHLLQTVRALEPDFLWRIRAFEGVNKGAIASG